MRSDPNESGVMDGEGPDYSTVPEGPLPGMDESGAPDTGESSPESGSDN
jgi:hypothetical protein